MVAMMVWVSPYLSAEGDCTWLTLGADAGRPWRVIQTAIADLTAQVFEVQELTSVYSTCHLAQEAVEGEMFDWRVKGGEVSRVPGIQRNTVHTLCLNAMTTPALVSHQYPQCSL